MRYYISKGMESDSYYFETRISDNFPLQNNFYKTIELDMNDDRIKVIIDKLIDILNHFETIDMNKRICVGPYNITNNKRIYNILKKMYNKLSDPSEFINDIFLKNMVYYLHYNKKDESYSLNKIDQLDKLFIKVPYCCSNEEAKINVVVINNHAAQFLLDVIPTPNLRRDNKEIIEKSNVYYERVKTIFNDHLPNKIVNTLEDILCII